ncbi:putative glycolipid-binding domain-containing protein [Bradyrhizobium sp. LHD-71]|uniref:putative glycolipid-binding domain-containing protein n=1 Tax=Bradyrhizobium sp. LHD-71 TaxID=3072141 RepID=UPI00280D0AC2|nr:putative glycolipid-binding domain-containing protein [Bradyrhizobium sp. LHD-71]MDQ8727321.1 putative glycolipid-binding domain-containing protein [Bradyrhizobium sp. LHD-71]
MSEETLRRWRRLDEPGLELMHLSKTADGVQVTSDLIHAGADPFGLRYSWSLDGSWRTKSLRISLRREGRDFTCDVERTGASSWSVDGQPRPDLSGCIELDLSATPFCNSLAIRHLGATGELVVGFIQLPGLSITPSLQRYEAMGPNQWRFVDLGASKGFTAILTLDSENLVQRYEGLFEEISAP